MPFTRKLSLLFLALLAASLACSLNPAPAPTEDNQAIIETSVAATVAAQPTQLTQPPADTEPAPLPTDTTEPTPGDVLAPDPLGPGYTGLIWDFDSCYDFDTYQPSPAGGSATDACVNANGLMTFYNGALMSGYATFDAPSKNACIAAALAPDDLAPNSDLYLCLQTSEGVYGFFVMRAYQLDLNRFTFDMYLFP